MYVSEHSSPTLEFVSVSITLSQVRVKTIIKTIRNLMKIPDKSVAQYANQACVNTVNTCCATLPEKKYKGLANKDRMMMDAGVRKEV